VAVCCAAVCGSVLIEQGAHVFNITLFRTKFPPTRDSQALPRSNLVCHGCRVLQQGVAVLRRHSHMSLPRPVCGSVLQCQHGPFTHNTFTRAASYRV